MSLSAAHILECQDRPTVTIHVPEWADGDDDTVTIALPDPVAEFALVGSLPEVPDDADERTRNRLEFDEMVAWVSTCVVDPQSLEPLFGPDDIERLARKNGTAIHRCWLAVRQLQAAELAKVKDLVKNAVATAGGDSGCASPSTADTDIRK